MFNIVRVCQNQGIPGDEEGGGLIPLRGMNSGSLTDWSKRDKTRVLVSNPLLQIGQLLGLCSCKATTSIWFFGKVS